jgi:anti-sigma B factor antagonist
MKVSGPRNVIVVHLTDSNVAQDEDGLGPVQNQLLTLADEASVASFFLDFGNVEYASGRMLGMLVSLHKALVARGLHLTVGNLSPQLHEVFAVTKLDRFLDLQSTELEDYSAPKSVSSIPQLKNRK